MTLQQKLLAKKSKKGFTLVELVVVIAILAVLAAIAIPSVIGIISSASKSQVETDAASVDSAVKNFHAGIVGGTINASNLPSAVTTVGTFPAANAANATRSTYANQTATLQQAMQYAGVWDKLKQGVTGGNFGYADGGVVAAVDGDGNVISSTATGSKITKITDPTTIIGKIMKR